MTPLAITPGRDSDQTPQIIAAELRRRGFVDTGADVVVVGASQTGGERRTNLIRLLHVTRTERDYPVTPLELIMLSLPSHHLPE